MHATRNQAPNSLRETELLGSRSASPRFPVTFGAGPGPRMCKMAQGFERASGDDDGSAPQCPQTFQSSDSRFSMVCAAVTGAELEKYCTALYR